MRDWKHYLVPFAVGPAAVTRGLAATVSLNADFLRAVRLATKVTFNVHCSCCIAKKKKFWNNQMSTVFVEPEKYVAQENTNVTKIAGIEIDNNVLIGLVVCIVLCFASMAAVIMVKMQAE